MTCFESALKILGVRSHASSELFTKLKKKGFSLSEINTTLVECERYGFINDEIYAVDYAQILASRGYGKYVIQRKLKLLKISDDLIRNAIDKLDNEYEEAKRAFDYKMRLLKNEKDNRKRNEKLYRFMITRGFSSDIIYQLMRNNAIN